MFQKFILLLVFFSLACSSPSKNQTPPESHQTASSEAIQVAPFDGRMTLTQFAFGSCAHQKQPQPIWETILAKNPQIFLAMGDNVYASKPEDKPIGEQYRLQALVPEFRKFRAQIPILGVYDDHDFGENDGGVRNPEKETAQAEFLKFFPHDATQIPANQKGIYHSFVLGEAPKRVHLIFLDTRYNRTDLVPNPKPKSNFDKFIPTQDPNQAILGDEQWAWFESELKKPAEVRIVVSSIQLIAKDHGFEKWANFPKERKRFFDLLKKTKAQNVFVLSGDRHLAEISEEKIPGLGFITDITASAINRPSNIEEEKNTLRVGNFYSKPNFGWAQINWEQGLIDFQILDLKGEKVASIQKKLALKKNSKK